MTREIIFDGEIDSSDEPGKLSSRWFRSQLPPKGEDILVRVHSPGGSILEAFRMIDVLASFPGRKRAIVESMAFSAASVFLCAFDEIAVTENAFTMMHCPYSEGDEELSRSESGFLDSIKNRMVELYATKTKKPSSAVERMMAVETFLDAKQTVAVGLADKISTGPYIVARAIPARFVAKIRETVSGAKNFTEKWKAEFHYRVASGMTPTNAILAIDKKFPGLRSEMNIETTERRRSNRA